LSDGCSHIIMSSLEKNIIVKCNLCSAAKELSTSRNSTSNLKKHLDRCHANTKVSREICRLGEKKTYRRRECGHAEATQVNVLSVFYDSGTPRS